MKPWVGLCQVRPFFYPRGWEQDKLLEGYLAWGGLLSETLPTLYILAIAKGTKVADI